MGRTLLKDEIRLYRENGSCVKFRIVSHIGSGASCVVYYAICEDNTEHLLKEYYPRYLEVERDSFGSLIVQECKKEMFDNGLRRFRQGNECQKEVRLIENLKNFTSNIQGYFYGNNTEYIDMTVFAGSTYDKIRNESIHMLFRRMRVLVQVIANYHKQGLLHLDIKPENIFVRPENETVEDVILLDFDSIVQEKYRMNCSCMSYTKEWAAPEQLLEYKHGSVCKATDLFAIGEIIFTRIFGRHSTAAERRSFSSLEFDCSGEIFNNVNPKIYSLLNEFFKHTICGVVEKRYQTAEEMILVIDRIIQLADPQKPFLKKSFPDVLKLFIGRDDEMRELHEKIEKNNIVFLSGIGGIGKSELAKQYAKKYENEYDVILVLPFVSDIETMITDDYYLPIHNFFREENETNNRYFERKINKVRELCDKRVLIIVDNLDTMEDTNLDKLFNLGCKMIVTTRMDFSDIYPETQINLGALSEPIDIFYEYYKKTLLEDERKCVYEIIKIVCGHTMMVELFAKQMMLGRIKPQEMLDKLRKDGITGTGDEKICNVKDGKIIVQNLHDHIRALFDMTVLDEKERAVITNLSLIPYTGMGLERFCDWCKISNFDVINKLIVGNWIRLDYKKDYISLHPVISDIAIELCNDNICLPFLRGIEAFLRHNNCKEMFLEIRVQVFLKQITDQNTSVIRGVANRLLIAPLNNTTVVSILNNVGVSCIGEYDNGYKKENSMPKYLYRALDICQKIFGEGHPNTVHLINNLGVFYLYSDNLDKAKECFENAYNISKVLFRGDNLLNVRLLFNLGVLYNMRNEYDTALLYFNKVLDLHKMIFGEKHSIVAQQYRIISGVYRDKGDYFFAIINAKKSLKIYSDIYGSNSHYAKHVKSILKNMYDIILKKPVTFIPNSAECYYNYVICSEVDIIQFDIESMDFTSKYLGSENEVIFSPCFVEEYDTEEFIDFCKIGGKLTHRKIKKLAKITTKG